MLRRVLTLVLTLLFLPVLMSAAPVNLALNQPATASAVFGGENIGSGCCGAFWGNDGDPTTHWSATWAPAWWEVDLGSAQAIAQIWYSGADNAFTLMLDGVSIASGSTTRANTDWIYSFSTPRNARVIRFDFTGGNDWAVVYEMRAFAPDIQQPGVPEPFSLGLAASGLVALGLLGRMRRSR